GARAGGAERRESDGNHADVRAVTAVAAPGPAGAGVGSTTAVAGSSWARRGGVADTARRAVTRVARRAGGGAGPRGARAAMAGPRVRRRPDRQALRARLGHVAGEVDVGGQRNGRLRLARADVDRAARRRRPGVQRAGAERRERRVRDRQRRAEVAPGGGA